MPRRDTRLFKRKGSPNWFGRLPRGDGTYAKKSLKTTEYRVARARLRAWAIEFAGTKTDRPSNPHSGLTLADALVECELWHRDRVETRKKYIAKYGWRRSKSRPPGCSESTLKIFTKKGRHLARLMATIPLEALDETDTSSYVETRRAEGAGSNTISKELIELRKTLKLAESNGRKLSGPAATIVPPFDPEYQPRTKTLTIGQAEALLEVLLPHRQLWVILGLWVGARVSGIERLMWDHVDLDRRLITIPETKTANS